MLHPLMCHRKFPLLFSFPLADCGCMKAAAAELETGGLPAPRFSAEVGAGVEYDSNMSVEEVDRGYRQVNGIRGPE